MTKQLARKVALSLRSRGYVAFIATDADNRVASVRTDADFATVEDTIVTERIAQFSEVAALRQVASNLGNAPRADMTDNTHEISGRVYDDNGNRVGDWHVEG